MMKLINFHIIIGLICTDQDYDYLVSSKDHMAKRVSKTNYVSLILLMLMGIASQQIHSLKALSLLSSIIYFILFCIQLIWKPYYKQTTLKIVQFGYLYLALISLTLLACFNSTITQFYCFFIMILIPITYKIIMFLEQLYSIYLSQKIQLLKLILTTKDKHLFAQIHPFEIDQIMRLIFQDSDSQKEQSYEINNQTMLYQYYFVNQEQEDQYILNGSKRYVVKEEIIDGDLYVKKEQAFGNDEQLRVSLKEIFKKIFKLFLNESSVSQEKKADIRFYYLIFLMQIQKIPQQFLMQIYNKDQNEMSIKDQQMLQVLLQKFDEQLDFEKKVEGNTFSYFNNSFLLPIIFEQITFETANQLDKAINIKLNILYMMSNKFIDLEILHDRLVQIYKLRDRIVKNLNSLASMNQVSEELHYLYMNFLENLSFSERDVKINYQQKQLNFIQKHFFQEDTGVLFVSIQKERQNLIKKVSNSFCKLFEVIESDIINTEVDRFIPSQIQQRHKVFIQRFLENPNLCEQNIYKDMLFGITKPGYILPLEMNLRLTQFIVGSEYSNDFGIAAFVKGIKQNNEYILYENSKKNKIVSITKNFHQSVFGHIKDFKKIEIKKFFPFLKSKNAIRQLYTYEKTLKTFNHTNTNNSSYFQSTTNVNSLKKIQTQNNIKNNDQDYANYSQGVQSEPAQSSRHPQSYHSQYDNFTTFYDDEEDQKYKNNDEDQSIEEDFPEDFVFIMIVEKPQTQFSNIKQKLNTANSIQNLYAQVNQQSHTAKTYSFYQMRVNVRPFRNRVLNLNYLEIESLTEINPVLCSQTILPILTNNEIAEIKTNKFSVNQNDLEKFILELQNIQSLAQIQQQQGPVSSISEESEEYDEAITPYIYQKRRTTDLSQKITINNTSIQVNENAKSIESNNLQTNTQIKNKAKGQMEKVVETKEENENDLLSQRQPKIIEIKQIQQDNQQIQNEVLGYQDMNLPLNSPIINSGHLSTNNMPFNMLSPKSLNILSYQDLNNEYDNLNYTKNNDIGDIYKHEFSMNNQVNLTQMKQIDEYASHEANILHNSQSQSISYIKASTQISRNKLFSNYSEQSHNAVARQQKFFSKQQSQIDEQIPSEHKSSDKKQNQENKEEKDLQEALEVSSTHSRSSNLSSTKKNIKKIVKTKKSLFIMKMISIVGFLCVCAIIGVTVQQYYQIITIFDDQIQNFKVFDWPMQIQSQMSLIQKNVNFQTLLGSRNQLPIASGSNVTQLNYQSNQELNISYSYIIILLQQMQQPSKQIQIFYYVRQTPSNFTYIPQQFYNKNRPNCTQNGTTGGGSAGGSGSSGTNGSGNAGSSGGSSGSGTSGSGSTGGSGSSGTSGNGSTAGSGSTGNSGGGNGNSGAGSSGAGTAGGTGTSGNTGTGGSTGTGGNSGTGASGSTGKGGSGSTGKGGSGSSGTGSGSNTGTGGSGGTGTSGNSGTAGSSSSGNSGSGSTGNNGNNGNTGTGGSGSSGTNGSNGASGGGSTGTGGSGNTGTSGNSGAGSSGNTGTGGSGSQGSSGNSGTGGNGSSGTSGNSGASGGGNTGGSGNSGTGNSGKGNGGGGNGNRNCSNYYNNTNWQNQSNNQFNFSLFYSTMKNTTYTLDYSLLLQSENIFSYAFLNDDQGTSERGFITNMFVLKDQLKTVYYTSKQQMYDQLNNTQNQLNQLMIIIMIVLACCLIVVIPLFSFIQTKREQILKLFGTFDSQKLEIKIIQLNTLYFQNNTSFKKGSVNLKTKLNQQATVKQKQQQQSKKQILSSTSSLPRINKTILVFTAISYCLSIIYPLLNEYITSNYTQQGKYNTQLMSNLFEIQSFILASVAQNYFCLILKGFPQKKQYNVTLQVQTLQDMYTQGQSLISDLQQTIQQQQFISRFEQNLYDDFLFELLNNDVCAPLNQYQQYQNQQNLIPQSNCTSIRNGILTQGLQISLKKFTEVFPDMLSMYQISNSTIFAQKFTAYQASFNFAEFNTFATYLAQIIQTLRTFIIQNSEDYFTYMKTFQIALLIYQLFVMVLIFYFGWFSFYKYLDHQLFQTKLLLSVMDVNSLIENSYIYNYLKRNVDL